MEPSREFWIPTMLKLLKTLFRLWGKFLPNQRILSLKNNEPTPLILFLVITVTTNTSDRLNVNLLHVWKSIKNRFSFVKKKIQLYWSTHVWLTIQLAGISLKLSPLISVTTSALICNCNCSVISLKATCIILLYLKHLLTKKTFLSR